MKGNQISLDAPICGSTSTGLEQPPLVGLGSSVKTSNGEELELIELGVSVSKLLEQKGSSI